MIAGMDDQSPGSVPDALRSAMEPWADISRRVAEAIRSATQSGAGALPGSDLLLRYAEQVSAVPRLWAEPLRRIVEEQRRLAELMAAWAEQHRRLAEQLGESAEHLRRLRRRVRPWSTRSSPTRRASPT